jgi:hypothetical protein
MAVSETEKFRDPAEVTAMRAPPCCFKELEWKIEFWMEQVSIGKGKHGRIDKTIPLIRFF